MSASALMEFTEENRADLVMMLPKSYNRFLFSQLESNTQQMARQSDVPVLAIVYYSYFYELHPFYPETSQSERSTALKLQEERKPLFH